MTIRKWGRDEFEQELRRRRREDLPIETKDLRDDIEENRPPEDNNPAERFEARVPNFIFEGNTYKNFKIGKDVDSVPLEDQEIALVSLRESYDLFPFEMLCYSSIFYDEEIEKLKLRNYTDEQISTWIRTKVIKRIPWEILKGEIAPLFFAGYQNSEVVSSASIINIRRLPVLRNQDPQLTRLSCSGGLVFPNITIDQVIANDIKFQEFILNQPQLLISSSQRFRVDEMHIPLDNADPVRTDEPESKIQLKSMYEAAINQAVTDGRFVFITRTNAEMGYPDSPTRTNYILTRVP
jgi:hypothetical protein